MANVQMFVARIAKESAVATVQETAVTNAQMFVAKTAMESAVTTVLETVAMMISQETSLTTV